MMPNRRGDPPRISLPSLVWICLCVGVIGYHALTSVDASLRANDITSSGGSDDPAYDHQTKLYTARFQPYTTSSVSSALQITPFFSPDHSIGVLTQLVESATSSIDMYTPGFTSWSGCTPFSGCYNCSIEYMRDQEGFPIWRALLNQAHRGVHVRILTNDYGYNVCHGAIGLLDYLALAGVQIKYYTTTTFMHTKYISVDGKNASVSSVNFSYTSLMKNREAGMLISGDDSVLQYYSSVFEFDWNQGNDFKVSQTYSPSQMQIIRDPTPIQVTIPPPLKFSCKVESPLTSIVSSLPFTAFASPDWSLTTVLKDIQSAKLSFDISIYQITSSDFANALISAYNRGVKLRIFVSRSIYSPQDYAAAQVVYRQLYSSGVIVNLSASSCLTYSHQKYWIADGSTVGLSSGNWSPTDFPADPMQFPPYAAGSSWRAINRDLNIRSTDSKVAAIFESVFNLDFSQSSQWQPR